MLSSHGSNTTVVILSTADYDSEVWTNKQHLAQGLASKHKVVYIESLGLRRPTFSRRDLGRVWQKLWRAKADTPADGESTTIRPEVLRPIVIPFHQFRIVRILNGILIRLFLIPKLPDPGDSVVYWTFSPLNYGLDGYFGRVVYHSVDLLHTIPGIPASTLLAAEQGLVRCADVVIASSNGVRRHLESLGAGDVTLWENVASVEIFSQPKSDRIRRAIFAGNLTPTKVHAELLLELAERGAMIALAGPVNIDGTVLSGSLTDLLNHKAVTYLGNLELPALAVEFSKSKVGLIPYHINEYTTGVFPMKVYEYLASGLSVVSTPLYSLKGRQIRGLHVAHSDEAYVEKVLNELAAFTDEEALARTSAASAHSWTRRIEQAELVLTGLTVPEKHAPRNDQ